MANKQENSVDAKSDTKTSLESLESRELSEEMRQTLEDYMHSQYSSIRYVSIQRLLS